MRKMKNLKGQKFGRLTAISPVAKNNLGAVLWLCECDCGLDTIVEGRSLTSGATRSCGCLDREAHKFRPNRTTHGKSGTRLYRIWKKMKSRCSNPNDPDYQQYYGSRGIIVCPEWLNDFQAFYDWAVSHGYSDELSIDRIDNEKGYSLITAGGQPPKNNGTISGGKGRFPFVTLMAMGQLRNCQAIAAAHSL